MDIMAGFQLINLLLLLLVISAGTFGFVMFLKVMFKLNKALDIWLEQHKNNSHL